MSGLDYFKKVLTEDYANFRGRARRSEYWYFALFTTLLAMVLAVASFVMFDASDGGSFIGFLPFGLFYLAIIIPTLAVTVRRLHDTGRSGWFVLINFIPYIGGIIMIVLCCFDSQPGTNKWGPNPKEMGDDTMSHLVDDDLV